DIPPTSGPRRTPVTGASSLAGAGAGAGVAGVGARAGAGPGRTSPPGPAPRRTPVTGASSVAGAGAGVAGAGARAGAGPGRRLALGLAVPGRLARHGRGALALGNARLPVQSLPAAVGQLVVAVGGHGPCLLRVPGRVGPGRLHVPGRAGLRGV